MGDEMFYWIIERLMLLWILATLGLCPILLLANIVGFEGFPLSIISLFSGIYSIGGTVIMLIWVLKPDAVLKPVAVEEGE